MAISAANKTTIDTDSYFNINEAMQFSFYEIPKMLFVNPYYSKISGDAKLLYGIMLDKMCLSQKNGWIDENGRAYILFSLEDVCGCMNCGAGKGAKLLTELGSEKGVGLIAIDEGRIYVMKSGY
jgi:hypothetical protein